VTLLSQVFVLYFIFVPVNSILFNSLLQLLLTDRNPQTFRAFVCFSFFFIYIFLATCAKLSWSHSAFESTLNSSIVSYLLSVLFLIPESRSRPSYSLVSLGDILFSCFVFRCILMTLMMWQFNLNDLETSMDISMDLSMDIHIHGNPCPYPIVFALEVSSRNSNAFPAKRGSNKGSGGNMLFSSFMRYLENGTRYVQSYY